MRNARDTFLKFLADHLTGITVTNLRRDVNDPQTSQLTSNAINCEFTYDRPGVRDSLLQASIDIVYDDELQAVDVATAVSQLLLTTEMTPLMSYADPANPVALGSMLRWSSRQVKFTKLVSDLSFRYNSHLLLMFYDPSLAYGS